MTDDAKLDKGWIRPYSRTFDYVFRLTDGVLITGVLFAIAQLRGIGAERIIWYASLAILTSILFLTYGEISNLYKTRRGSNAHRTLQEVAQNWIICCFTLFILGFLFKASGHYSRKIIVPWMLAMPLVLAGWRLLTSSLLRAARRHGYNTRSALIIGRGEVAHKLASEITEHDDFGFRYLGTFDTPPTETTGQDVEEAIQLAKSGRVDHIFLALPIEERHRLAEIIALLSDTTVDVSLVPDDFLLDLAHTRWSSIGQIPVIKISHTPFFGADGAIKRLEDVVLSALALLLLSPVMLFLAAAVKITSPGPILFRQRRYGISGKEFRVLKFRTMSVCEDHENLQQATRDDVRITPVGKWLRRFSLDELPQLINVFMGDMSLVGPRPHAIAQNESYRKLIPGYMMRHKVRPGMTGLAQIRGWRGETQTVERMKQRVACDLEYIQRWSIFMDLAILLKTPWICIKGNNAH